MHLHYPPAPIAFERSCCRSCGAGKSFTSILNLGPITFSDFLPPDAPDPPSVPVDLVVCEDCGLVQLRHTANPDRMFGQQYWYESGINETMVAELQDIVADGLERVGGLTHRDVVVDVGANDGTLLQQYAELAPVSVPQRVAFEPAGSFAERLRAHANLVVSDFFPQGLVEHGLPKRSVKILTSIACFYDVDAPAIFVEAVDHILADRGIWIIQLQDLAGMVQKTGYDNCCLEHLCYYSLQTLEQLLDGYDLQILDVARRAINGGSLRVILGRRRQERTPHANANIVQEVVWQQPWTSRYALDQFAHRARMAQEQLKGTVHQILSKGGVVDLYAASTKSSVLLQATGLNRSEIRQAVERSPSKFGRVTSATRIPIVPEGEWRQDPPSHTIIGAWGFREAFLQREAAYLAQGGTFLVPLPCMEIVQGARA